MCETRTEQNWLKQNLSAQAFACVYFLGVNSFLILCQPLLVWIRNKDKADENYPPL